MIDLTKYFDLTKPFQSSLQYPKEYNPRVHGPYNPARYYGKGKLNSICISYHQKSFLLLCCLLNDFKF